MKTHQLTKQLLIFSTFFLCFQCGSIDGYKWNTVVTENLPVARHECSFTEVNGLFYLLGGRGLKPVDIYDKKTNKWSKGAIPPIEIHHFQAVTYNDNIYVFGAMTGKYPHEKPIDKILIYKPKEDQWVWGDTIPKDRNRGSTGIVVKDDFAFIVCGIIDGHWSGHVSWVDKYNFKTGEWTVLANAPRSRDHFQAVLFKDKIYCASGRNSSAKTNETFSLTIPEVDIYDINNNEWITMPKSSNLPTQRAGASTIGYDGNLIVIGGESSAQKIAHNDVEIMNMVTGTWSHGAKLVKGRHGTQAILFNNSIYIVAGSGKRGGRPELDTLEVFSQ